MSCEDRLRIQRIKVSYHWGRRYKIGSNCRSFFFKFIDIDIDIDKS